MLKRICMPHLKFLNFMEHAVIFVKFFFSYLLLNPKLIFSLQISDLLNGSVFCFYLIKLRDFVDQNTFFLVTCNFYLLFHYSSFCNFILQGCLGSSFLIKLIISHEILHHFFCPPPTLFKKIPHLSVEERKMKLCMSWLSHACMYACRKRREVRSVVYAVVIH